MLTSPKTQFLSVPKQKLLLRFWLIFFMPHWLLPWSAQWHFWQHLSHFYSWLWHMQGKKTTTKHIYRKWRKIFLQKITSSCNYGWCVQLTWPDVWWWWEGTIVVGSVAHSLNTDSSTESPSNDVQSHVYSVRSRVRIFGWHKSLFCCQHFTLNHIKAVHLRPWNATFMSE